MDAAARLLTLLETLKDNNNKGGVVLFSKGSLMQPKQEPAAELASPHPIRVETALSRYPVHRLAKHGSVAIDIREKSEDGEVLIRWDVDYSKKRGQPGPLAYKLDTLIINRRIEEVRRPIPKMIRLGNLKDICRELGSAEGGKNTNDIKNALHQNASAYITAKIRYRQSNGAERSIEFGDTRYGVVFTGEKLPDGRTADAVYIVLHDFYREILDKSVTRPLDYGYLKSLPPAPQRLYELLSYQMYAAIKNDRPRAKLLYSEICMYAPLTRHSDWERARRQTAKIHAPHKQSGYLGKIDFEQTVDADGNLDWIMLYQPGPKARAEHRAFTKRGGPVMLETEPVTADPAPRIAASTPSPTAAELIGRGVTPTIAAELARDHDAEKIRRQIEILEWQEAKKPGKIADPAAWLVIAVKNDHAVPKNFVSKAQRQARDAAKQAQALQAAEEHHRVQREKARDRAERQAIAAYWASLTPQQQAALDAASAAATDPATLAMETGPLARMVRQIRRDAWIRELLDGRESPGNV